MCDTSSSFRFTLLTLLTLPFLPACREPARAPAAAAPGTEAPVGSVPDSAAQDQLLLATVKVALPPVGLTPADLPEPGSRGATVLARYCSQCHSLPSPAMHSANDWPSVTRRMWLRLEHLPPSQHLQGADIGDRIALLEYLQAQALKVSVATLPAGRGREQFAVSCSRCHALPDPHMHAPQDWVAVVVRMERNMERMHVAAVAPSDLARIIGYLEGPGSK